MNELITTHYRDIRRITYAMANSFKIDHEDFFHTVLEKLLKFKDKYTTSEGAKFTTYVYTVAKLTAIDHYRIIQKTPIHIEVDLIHYMLKGYEDDLEQGDHNQFILDKIHRVYGDTAYMLVTKLREGYKFHEVIEMTRKHDGESYHTLKARIYRMIREIKNDLQK